MISKLCILSIGFIFLLHFKNVLKNTFICSLFFYRREASLCPDVVVAQIDPKKLKKKQSVNVSVSVTSEQWLLNCKTYVCNNFAYHFFSQITGCLAAPQGFSPSLKWQEQQVSKFSEVRQVCNFNFYLYKYFYNSIYLAFVCLLFKLSINYYRN